MHKKANPLLNNSSKLVQKNFKNRDLVPGERISLKDYGISSVTPVHAVYAIYCSETGQYTAGETKNLKHRFKTHFDNLNEGEAQPKRLQADFNNYGPNSFEFVIIDSGSHLTDFKVRKKMQDEWIAFLNLKNACYTSGRAETVTPRYQGKFPSKAGIWYLYCTKTDCYYYGHAEQERGITGRIHSVIARLNSGESGNVRLQADWDTYGQQAFEISSYVFGDEYITEISRVKVLNALIYNRCITNSKGTLSVYNTHYHGLDKQQFPLSQIPPAEFLGEIPEKMEHTPTNYGDPNRIIYPRAGKFAGKEPIELADRIPVYCDGAVYFSIKEASENCGIHQGAISTKVNRNTPEFHKATVEEIQLELERRDWSMDKSKAINKTTTFKRDARGVRTSVVVKGKLFESKASAARYYKVSDVTIRNWIKKGSNNSFIPEEGTEKNYPGPD